MELTVGINSYMDIEEADTLLNDELFSDDEELITWKSLSSEDKTKLIIKGTREVEQLPFLGYKINTNSRETLQWPRLLGCEVVECPRDIKLGILRQALRAKINRGSQYNKLMEMGVSNYKIKDASVSFSDTNNKKLSNGIYTDIYYENFKKWTY